MTRPASALLLLLTLPALSIAQSVSGTWLGVTGGGLQITLELNTDGELLTGTMTRGTEAADITDGAVVENTIRFRVRLRDQTASFSGELAGEQLTLSIEGAPESAIVFTRAR